MKISDSTVAVLKNFATICPSILIRQGNELRTIAPKVNNIFAMAKIDDSFPRQFAIQDLNRLLSTLSLISDPDITFEDASLVIKSASGASVRYVYASEKIVLAPDKPPVTAVDVASVNLSQKDLAEIQKAASVMGLQDISFIGTPEGTVSIHAHNTNNPSSDNYVIPVTINGKITGKFKVNLKTENLKLLPATYKADICLTKSKMCCVRFDNGKVTYFLAAQEDSEVTTG